MDQILGWAQARRDELIALLKELVDCESPSDDAAAVNRFQELLATRSAGLATPKFTRSAGAYGHNLRLDFVLPGPRRKTPGCILGVGHADTVWRLGTLQSMPFRRESGRLWGPGVLDMKAGLAFFLYAMKALRDLDLPVSRKGVTVGGQRRRSGEHRIARADRGSGRAGEHSFGARAGHWTRRQVEDGAQRCGQL